MLLINMFLRNYFWFKIFKSTRNSDVTSWKDSYKFHYWMQLHTMHDQPVQTRCCYDTIFISWILVNNICFVQVVESPAERPRLFVIDVVIRVSTNCYFPYQHCGNNNNSPIITICKDIVVKYFFLIFYNAKNYFLF